MGTLFDFMSSEIQNPETLQFPPLEEVRHMRILIRQNAPASRNVMPLYRVSLFANGKVCTVVGLYALPDLSTNRSLLLSGTPNLPESLIGI